MISTKTVMHSKSGRISPFTVKSVIALKSIVRLWAIGSQRSLDSMDIGLQAESIKMKWNIVLAISLQIQVS